jgi:hypothetical protein
VCVMRRSTEYLVFMETPLIINCAEISRVDGGIKIAKN